MEFEFKYFKYSKDATNFLLTMDHDSGYVEGAENTPSSMEYEPSKQVTVGLYRKDFPINEDALLEKPVASLNWSADLPYEIPVEDHEETRKLFFSPDVVESSVPSQGSSVHYSGLESDSCSEREIPVQKPIVFHDKCMIIESTDNDVLTLTGSESDKSLEETFVSQIVANRNICTYNECSLQRASCSSTNKSSHAILECQNLAPPTCENQMPSLEVSKTISSSQPNKRLTLVFWKSDQENYSVKRKYPSMTPEKQPSNPVDFNISPDIFNDEDIPLNNSKTYFDNQDNFQKPPCIQTKIKEKPAEKLDQRLLKRINKGMSGVLPPPSVTVLRMTLGDMMHKLEENKSFWFWKTDPEKKDRREEGLNSSGDSGGGIGKSVLLSVSLEEVRESQWPEVLDLRCHGLHYNCSKISEEIMDLCDKYQKRFVGAETQSTCTIFEVQPAGSPSKRKTSKPRWGGGKSPGRRLSHLARRRITFSSANLQASGSSLAGSRARQILVDAKKIDLMNRRKSPRKSPRKTPNKSPKVKTRTPSSSAKKKLALRFRKLTGEIENVGSKRALFKSPARDSSSLFYSSAGRTSDEKPQLRRALFASPSKGRKSPVKLRFGFEKKRKRSESDEMGHPSKFARSMSMDVKPASASISKPMPRTQSELNISLNKQNELSEQHKKKLLWAVSGALQSQNITNSHPQWKVFASVLARVTRRFFISQMIASGGAKCEGGTSERMHRIARYHVISVIKGKTPDEIVHEYLRNKAKVQRPQGYVPPAEMRAPSGDKENVFQARGNTLESWEKRRAEQQPSKQPLLENKIERIRKVINFGDDS
ncbi:uncharacterized protein mi isoform X2 [Euwallacea similis]|uniref:uncharacterized protein mi isoform X2 n=1 Tax=Euwallacea similis TaxID=1736056 RepID=UPI00344DE278